MATELKLVERVTDVELRAWIEDTLSELVELVIDLRENCASSVTDATFVIGGRLTKT